MNIYCPIVILCLLQCVALAQPPGAILLQNPSFEGQPRHGFTPDGWLNCGFPGESPPDLHPSGAFGISRTPYAGISYLGMVVRARGPWEAVGQKLSQPLAAGQCYRLSLYACQSELLSSITLPGRQPALFDKPVALRLWGGGEACRREQLLAVSAPVHQKEWVRHELYFRPQQDWSYLLLEVYFTEGLKAEQYNGHALIDALSNITPVACEGIALFEHSSPEEIPGQNAPVAGPDERAAPFSPGYEDYLRHFLLSHTRNLELPTEEELSGPEADTLTDGQAARQLQELGAGLAQTFNTANLEMSVEGKSRKEIRKRIKFIRKQLRAGGFPANQRAAIHPLRKSDYERADWLWPVGERDFVVQFDVPIIFLPLPNPK